MNWEVEFFRTAGGREPITEFLDSLSVKERTKALRAIQLLEEFGSRLGMPHEQQTISKTPVERPGI